MSISSRVNYVEIFEREINNKESVIKLLLQTVDTFLRRRVEIGTANVCTTAPDSSVI